MEPNQRRRQEKLHGLLVVTLIWLMSGCAHLSTFPAEIHVVECEMGGMCVVDGIIVGTHPWEMAVEDGARCITMAVPDSLEGKIRSFTGKRARIIGTAYRQPPMDKSFYYVVREMRVNNNFCDFALVVEAIVTTGGQSWVRPIFRTDETQ